MSDFRTRLLGIAALGMAMAGLSYGQTVNTTGVGGVPTTGPELTLRAEGETELVGDTTTTYVATNAANITNVTVYATLSLPITGKSFTPAPGGTGNSTATLTIPVCNAVPAQTINGVVGGTTVSFSGITLGATAGGTACTITISNIRVNASGSGNPVVTESVLLSFPNSPTTSANAPGSPSPVPVGFILQSLSVTPFVFPLGSFSTCVGGTPLTAGNPPALTGKPSFSLTINELTAGAWKTQPGENDGAFADSTQATEIQLAFANVPASATIYVPLTLQTPALPGVAEKK